MPFCRDCVDGWDVTLDEFAELQATKLPEKIIRTGATINIRLMSEFPLTGAKTSCPPDTKAASNHRRERNTRPISCEDDTGFCPRSPSYRRGIDWFSLLEMPGGDKGRNRT